jgi:hypothetical protein
MELTRKTQAYLINELNELGQNGWELVSVNKHKEARAGSGEAWFWTAFVRRPQVGHAPAAATHEKAAAEAPAPAPAPINQPAKLQPSADTGEEFDFADTPSDEESPREEAPVEQSPAEK